jgi:O-antigen ligase
MYEDMGATLPNLTTTFLNTSGWIPGGIFLILAGLLVALVALKKPRFAGIVAVPTLLFLIGTAVVLPKVLMMPLSQIIRDVEALPEQQRSRIG